MLNAMATACEKDGNEIFLVISQEWDLLKMFANELLAFQEATEIFLSQIPSHHLILLLYMTFY